MRIKEFKENREFKDEMKHDILFSIHWLNMRGPFLYEQGPELL